MFIHGKTGKIYRSVREKLKYFKGRVNDNSLTKEQREYAKKRVDELQPLADRTYDEPTMIVTNDKHFGNKIDKPRACVVIGKDYKNRLLAYPIHHRMVKTVILDNDVNRQVDSNPLPIADSEVYENKFIEGLATLTDYDKKKLLAIHKK